MAVASAGFHPRRPLPAQRWRRPGLGRPLPGPPTPQDCALPLAALGAPGWLPQHPPVCDPRSTHSSTACALPLGSLVPSTAWNQGGTGLGCKDLQMSLWWARYRQPLLIGGSKSLKSRVTASSFCMRNHILHSRNVYFAEAINQTLSYNNRPVLGPGT